jgi:FixJ family two-component response regulator
MLMNKDKPLNAAEPVVFIVDDDAALREVLCGLFRSVGLQAQTFGSAREFLQVQLPDAPCCLILDVRLPGISGIDFQTELQNAGMHIPIIFVTGYGDVPMTVKAMKAGAVEFLTKPFRDQELLDAVRVALESHRDQRERDKWVARIKASFDTLTPRELEVISLVSTGLMNKQIAGKLDISEITVKVHRVNGMRKIGARSMAELVRMADALGIKQEGVRR